MLFFVVGDVLEVIIVRGAEAGLQEVFFCHTRNGAFVKSILEMLQGESILEYVHICDGRLTFDGVSNCCDCQKRRCCEGSRELHVVW